MNVLITSVARKVWLVEAFRRALAATGGQVLASDADPLAVGLRLADGAIELPRLDEACFESALLAARRVRAIGLIVPTRDAELPWFACRRERLAAAGATVMVAAPETIALCQDKLAFADFCRANGFEAPEVLRDPARARFPLFVRPWLGAGGRGARRIDDAATLAELTAFDDHIVQAFVDAPEFTIDLFADFAGQVLTVVPRRRLRVAAGESVVGVTVEAPPLIARAVALSGKLGLVGHNTLQCFWDGGEPSWIEVNPRYGGGAALGFAAGADTPSLLARLAAGETIAPRIGAYERGLYLFRYGADHFSREAA